MDIRFGEWVLDRGRRELLRGDEGVPLTAKAFQLLDLLLENRPKVVTKAQIYETLWPSTFVSEGNVSRLVFELRAALDDKAARPRWIRTVRGFGYAFAGAITSAAPAAVAGGGQCRLILSDREVILDDGETVLGRTREVAIWLRSRSVSRRHARIVVRGGQAMLDDLGSKNGTFRRGAKVTAPTPLADGDEIRIGTVAMIFRVIPPEDSTETTS